MRITHSLVQVARELMDDSTHSHWGYDLSRRSGVRSGVLYPILQRLLDAGWVSDGWETAEEQQGPRPRRYYELTDTGRRELGALLSEAETEARFAGLFRIA